MTEVSEARAFTTGAPVGLARSLVLPLLCRLQLGEGALLFVNIGLLAATKTEARAFAVVGLVSLVALALIYALNDLWDAAVDRENPRKHRGLADFLVEHFRSFGVLLLALHGALVAFAFATLGPAFALKTALVLGLNALYTFYFKGTRVADVVVVGAWGAAYAWLVGSLAAVPVVGAMTAASHVFQTMGDRTADLGAGIRTSAERSTTSRLLLAASSAALVGGFFPFLGAFAALGASPLLFGLTLRSSYRAWLLSKLVFGVLFLALLWKVHGRL